MTKLRMLTAACLATSWRVALPAGDALAEGCPDVEVVFARGTAEPPGVGWIGQQFIDALRWRTGGRAVQVYAVDFPSVHDFAPTVAGAADAATHIRGTAEACPATALVLGGYSRGAALIGYATAASAPAAGFPDPLPPEVSGHVAAVALLGKPSAEYLGSIGAPAVAVGPDYAAKTIDLCAPGDPICSAGDDGAVHSAYAFNGMTVQAADFAADHLRPADTVPAPHF